MNTTARHTPGPWSVVDVLVENSVAPRLGVFPVKRVWGDPAIADCGYNEGNAALIAAAPELLAALDWCVRALEIESGTLYAAHLEQARSAIAKATGAEVAADA